MKFSLTVTCYNEMKSLPQWHEDLQAQTRQPNEIVIVDSESTDGTTELLKEWTRFDPRVKLIVKKCSPAKGHNIAVEAAAYEHVVSTDMGIRIDPEWFEEIVRPFEEDESVDIVAGSYASDITTITVPAARAEYYIEGDFKPRLKPGFIPSNRSMAYTKTVWRELGGLPEDLTRYADDSVFGRQMVQSNFKMAFAPNAIVYWRRPEKLRDFWKETYNYGLGDGEANIKTPIAFQWHKKGFLPGQLVPLITAIRVFTKQIGRTKVKEALRKKDIIGLLYVPILIWGRGWYFGKGYLKGDKRGKKECQQCRNRLK